MQAQSGNVKQTALVRGCSEVSSAEQAVCARAARKSAASVLRIGFVVSHVLSADIAAAVRHANQ